MTTDSVHELTELAGRYVALGRRRTQLMHGAQPGVATPEVAQALDALARDYEALLALGEPAYPVYTAADVRAGHADTVAWAAHAHEAVGAVDAAAARYHQAAELFRGLGDDVSAGKCNASATRLAELVDRDVDGSIARLHAQLGAVEPGTIERVEVLIELGELQTRGGDEYEALDTLRRAEDELGRLPVADAAGAELDAALEAFASQPELATSKRLEGAIKAHLLQVRLCQALAQILADSEPSAAREYLERAQRLRYGDPANRVVARLSSLVADKPSQPVPRVADVPDSIGLAQELTSLAAASAAGEIPPDALLLRAGMLYDKALRSGIPELIAVAAMRRAELLLTLDRIDEAIGDLAQARAIVAGTLREHELGARALALLARAHATRGAWADVSEVCGGGIELVEAHRYNVSSEYMRDAYLRSRIELYSVGVRAAYELGDVDRMLERADLSKSRSLLGYRATQAREDASSADEEFERVCDEIDQARRHGPVPDELLRRRRVLWDLRLIERRGTGVAPPSFSPAALQQVLLADEAVLYHYWLDRSTLLVVAIDRDRIVPELRRVDAATRNELDAFADGVLAASLPRPGGFDAAARFSTLLLPADDGVLAEKRRLFVSPHRVLHAIPFHALTWDEAPLVERFSVAYVPNLTSLLLLEPERRRQARVLTLGITQYRHADTDWPELPHAVAEARAVGDAYAAAGASVLPLLAEDAEESGLGGRSLDEFACVHLATHGMSVNADTPMESYLCLHSSRLDGLEIASRRFAGELVVLSACCSGQRPISGRGVHELPGDELFGLQAAFFAAGAQAVVGCLWPVHDETAGQIMPAFHAHVAAGSVPDVALQQAVTDYLAAAGPLRRKPYFWAPFFVSALGRPRPLFDGKGSK